MVSEFSTLCNRRTRACRSIIPARPPVGPVFGVVAGRAEFDPNHPVGAEKNGTWSPSAPGAYLYGAGGGTSRLFAQPPYQAGFVS